MLTVLFLVSSPRNSTPCPGRCRVSGELVELDRVITAAGTVCQPRPATAAAIFTAWPLLALELAPMQTAGPTGNRLIAAGFVHTYPPPVGNALLARPTRRSA